MAYHLHDNFIRQDQKPRHDGAYILQLCNIVCVSKDIRDTIPAQYNAVLR
jgi:hypothetical protein